MADDNGIFIGKGEGPVQLLPHLGNRHGLVAGATGTGKTVTLQVLAEGFSAKGVPVFMADVKGDLSGICQAGENKPKLVERAQAIGLTDYRNEGFPVEFWDIYGEKGHPVRGTVSDMGPLLLSRLLDLNDTQEGVLNIAFKLADDQGLLLIDFKDLRAILDFVGEHAAELKTEYGNISATSVGAIQRDLLVLEQQGAEKFLGEPALELADLMRATADGRGIINILCADKLMQNPRLYATFLLWLLSELFEELPEVGDPEKPKLVFFFDEAHLLFDGAPDSLVQKVEQVVRLIRSKGVGVYFITQNPLDVPDKILGQLGNRVQHALRAFTPRDQKAVRAAAETFRENPKIDTATAITELAVGEALASMLDDKGIPTPVDRILVRPPSSRLGPADEAERTKAAAASAVGLKYNQVVDRESAYEMLKKRAAGGAAGPGASSEAPVPEPEAPQKSGAATGAVVAGAMGGLLAIAGAFLKSAARSVGTQLGHQITRGMLGGRARTRR
ncbi:MAG: DUF853 domain-containing protein [Candidatus Sumerlaeaceae bacterium]|nr:DUF853 domain-containing protein [Candidatus Sumerlaeaceae bacterium]